MFEFNESTEALAFPLELAELDGLDAKTITDKLIHVLQSHGDAGTEDHRRGG